MFRVSLLALFVVSLCALQANAMTTAEMDDAMLALAEYESGAKAAETVKVEPVAFRRTRSTTATTTATTADALRTTASTCGIGGNSCGGGSSVCGGGGCGQSSACGGGGCGGGGRGFFRRRR